MHAVGSADDKEEETEHKGTVVEAADTRVNPEENEHFNVGRAPSNK